MRHISLPMVCISIAVLASGCGHVTTPTSAVAASSVVSAQSAAVDTGTITFDTTADHKAIDLLGIGPVAATKLAQIGIGKCDELLMQGATPTGRKHIAQQTGLSEKDVLTWVNHSDLMRVMGCGPEYARLLERAGVDTVPDLATRNSLHLAAAMPAANDLGGGKVCVHRLPNVVTCTKWVQNAQQFARIVKY